MPSPVSRSGGGEHGQGLIGLRAAYKAVDTGPVIAGAVPILDEHYKLPKGGLNEKGVYVSGSDIMLQQSDKPTVFGNDLKHKREGFVLRLRNNYNVSFKVKNPNYSL